LKLTYGRIDREIEVNESFMLKEMLTYVFKEYLNDKNTRRINTQLSLRSMKNNNPNDFDDKKTEYKNIYDSTLKKLKGSDEQSLRVLSNKVKLNTKGKEIIDYLYEIKSSPSFKNNAVSFSDLNDNNFTNLTLQTPTSSGDLRAKKRKGFEQAAYNKYMQGIEIEKEGQKTETIESKNKEGKKIKVKRTTDKKIIKFNEFGLNPLNPNERDKVNKINFLYNLGVRPITLTRIVISTKGKSVASKERKVGGKEGEIKDIGRKTTDITGGEKESTPSLLNTRSNKTKYIFESMFDLEPVGKNLPNRNNASQVRLYKFLGDIARQFKKHLKNVKELSKKAKEDVYEMVLSEEDKKFNKKHFPVTEYNDEGEISNNYKKVGNKTIERKLGERKLVVEKDSFKILSFDEINELKSISTSYAGKGGKSVASEFKVQTLEDLINSVELKKDTDKVDFNKFKRAIKVLRLLLNLSSTKQRKKGAPITLEGDSAKKYKQYIKDFNIEIQKMQRILTSNIKESNAAILSLKQKKKNYVDEKLEKLKTNRKKILTTRTMPEEFKDKYYLDPEQSSSKKYRRKKWTEKDFFNLLESGFFGPKAKEGTKPEDMSAKERRRYDLEEASKTTQVINVSDKEYENFTDAKNARKAFNDPKGWTKSIFAEPFRDMSNLYNLEIRVSKIKTGKESPKYKFEVFNFGTTHEITQSSVDPRAKGKEDKAKSRFAGTVKRDKDLITDVNVFINSVRTNIDKLEKSLLRGV